MRELTRVLTDRLGLHAEPAVVLALEARKWVSRVDVHAGEREADGRDPMALMALDAREGCELRLCLEGADEDDAAAAFEKLLSTM